MTKVYRQKDIESLLRKNKTRQEIKDIMLKEYKYIVSLKQISKINKNMKERNIENFCREIEQILKNKKVLNVDDWLIIRNKYHTPSKIFITQFPNDYREIRRDVDKNGNIIRLLKDGEQYYLEMLIKHSINVAKLRSITDYDMFLKPDGKTQNFDFFG